MLDPDPDEMNADPQPCLKHAILIAGEMSIIRRTVRARYALLPFWYTLFYEAELTGELAIHCMYST
jgi:hypothetical protein